MGFEHGKNSAFKVDNAAGTLTDVSSYVDDCSLTQDVDTSETTAFGDDSRAYIVGLKDGSFSVSGHWDGATSAGDSVLSGIVGLDASSSFEYSPGGTASGAAKFTGEAFLTSYDVSSAVADQVSFSANFQVTGGVTRGTHD